MSTEPSTSATSSPQPPSSSSSTSSSSSQLPTNTTTNAIGNWKLPTGIEDHIEDGVLKMTAGILIGGTLGMLLFKSGKGWRSTSIASGLGVAIGSTYVRFMSSMNHNSSNQNNTTNDTTSSQTIATPGARLQPFDTKPLPTIGTNPPKAS